jgi:predicted permease
MLNDLKYAFRVIAKYPVSNGVIVFTIASLVAAIGLLYHSVNLSLGEKNPFEDSDRLVRFWRITDKHKLERFPATMFADLQKTSSFEKIGAFRPNQRHTLTGAGEPVTLNTVATSAEVLDLTGFKPLLGRFFSRTDELAANRKIVVLSERIWRKYLKADVSILGREIKLNKSIYVVVGIVPDALHSTDLVYSADLWMPFDWKKDGKESDQINIVARIKPDRSRVTAQAEIDVIAAQVADRHPATQLRSIRLAALDQHLNRGGMSGEQVFVVLFGFTLMGCIVLIACFNMTSLFLVQATSRAREFAVRLSVGASRWRIVRQMLIESILLSIAGGLAGLGLTFSLKQLITFNNLHLTVSTELLLITFGSAVAIGALVSILPALRAGRTNLNYTLKDGGQSSAARGRHRLRNFLIGSQVGMATVLTISGVLFSRAFISIISQDLPIDSDRIVRVDVMLEQSRYGDADKVSDYAQQALAAVEQMPGIERACVSSVDSLPSWYRRARFTFHDQAINDPDGMRGTFINISDEYFDMFGQSLARGRSFSKGTMALNEALVNEEFVREHLGAQKVIGQELILGNGTKLRATIIGIVANRHPKLEVRDTVSEVYLSHENPFDAAYVTATVETKADAAQFGLALRETLQRLDGQQPVGQAIVLTDQIESQLQGLRRASIVLLSMAAFGLFMSLMGVYGVVAYAVIERTREMGIRMALGAGRRRIVRLIMTEGTRLLIFGIIPGTTVIALLFQGLPKELLSNIDPKDPWTFIIGVAAIFVAGTIAAVMPARKMINLKPNEALRYE